MGAQAKRQAVPQPQSEIFDLDKVYAASLKTKPYDYMVVQGFIRPEWKEKLLSGYPVIAQGGSFPLPTVTCGADFKALIDEMNGDAFRAAIEQKFSLNLKGKPTMFTVRGKCRQKDGRVHTDTESKIITVLLYMNPEWANQGGRLRVLGSNNLEDVAEEISPDIGTLLVFRRANNSWHGHLPFDGERRVIQMNWVTEQKFVDREQKRHFWSALMKRLGFSY